MHSIISLPALRQQTKKEQTEQQFGYFEDRGVDPRRDQEDTLTWGLIPESEVTHPLPWTAPELAQRLWSTNLTLHGAESMSLGFAGTTASTIVYDGRDNVISSTVGDAISYAAVYSEDGKIQGVTRLNRHIHHPKHPSEMERIKEAEGFVFWGRLGGQLAVSRAIGDKGLTGISAEASIDCLSTGNIATRCGMETPFNGTLKLIVCCDGYTEPCDRKYPGETDDVVIRTHHEDFLLGHLKALEAENPDSAIMPESGMAEWLVARTIAEGSRDNVSMGIQTIKPGSKDLIQLSVFDGHGGPSVSRYVAESFQNTLQYFFQMSAENYAAHPMGVMAHVAAWNRDNPELALPVPTPQPPDQTAGPDVGANQGTDAAAPDSTGPDGSGPDSSGSSAAFSSGTSYASGGLSFFSPASPEHSMPAPELQTGGTSAALQG